MAREKLEIDPKKLQAVINELEAKQTFNNLSELWVAVENTEWAKSLQPRPLKAPVVYQRVNEHKLTYKTVAGKRGRMKGAAPVQRTKRADKFAKSKELKASFAEMRETTPEKYHNLIERAEQGSAKAAMKLKCLNCSGFQPKEVKLCGCPDCALYPFRPFQNSDVDEPEIVEIQAA